MKTRLRFLLAVLLICSFAGCASQKKLQKSFRSAESEVLHQQALKALVEGRFIIRVDEFYPDGEPVKMATDSYMLMRDDQYEIKFSPDLSTGLFYMSDENYMSNTKITKGKSKKNGDIQFDVKIFGAFQWKEYRISITLYNDTNQCFVQLQNQFNKEIIGLKGHIYPLAD